jgi:hypothetical protein
MPHRQNARRQNEMSPGSQASFRKRYYRKETTVALVYAEKLLMGKQWTNNNLIMEDNVVMQ